MELTKIGMEMLIHRIERRKIVPPDDMELDRLTAYLLGYTNCDCDIMKILFKTRDELEK